MQVRVSHLLLGLAVSGAAQAAGLTPESCAAVFTAGDFRGATNCYQVILKQDPDNAAAHLGAGVLALYANDLQSAARELRAAQNHGLDESRIARLLEQLEARTPPPGQYQIDMGAGPVRIPFVLTDPLPVVKVRVQGERDAYFYLDTGAGPVVLDSQLATQLGIKVTDAFIGTFAGGRRAPVQRAMLDAIALEGVTITHLPVDVLPTRHLKLQKDIQIEGTIGTGLLSQFLATIDYAQGTLVLRPRSGSPAFESRAARSGAVRVPMWLVGDHFLFARGRLGDAPEGLFMIDTGCAGCGVTATGAALKAAHIDPDPTHAYQGIGAGGPVTVLRFTADVTLGSVTRHAVRGHYTPQGSPYGIFPFEIQGSISHGFFRPYALTIDFNAMLLVLQQ